MTGLGPLLKVRLVSDDELVAPPVDLTRWLNPDERRAWVGLVALMTRLPSAIEAPLRRDHGLSLYEYHALAMLSETPGLTLPLKALAKLTNGSLSRLSHVLDRLEARGYLIRQPSTRDGRVTEAVLSELGLAALTRAATEHVATVRELVFDALTPEQVRQLGDASLALLTQMGVDIAQTPGFTSNH